MEGIDRHSSPRSSTGLPNPGTVRSSPERQAAGCVMRSEPRSPGSKRSPGSRSWSPGPLRGIRATRQWRPSPHAAAKSLAPCRRRPTSSSSAIPRIEVRQGCGAEGSRASMGPGPSRCCLSRAPTLRARWRPSGSSGRASLLAAREGATPRESRRTACFVADAKPPAACHDVVDVPAKEEDRDHGTEERQCNPDPHPLLLFGARYLQRTPFAIPSAAPARGVAPCRFRLLKILGTGPISLRSFSRHGNRLSRSAREDGSGAVSRRRLR